MKSALVGIIALVLGTSVAPPAMAQEGGNAISADFREKARKLADEGLVLFENGKYQDALAAFLNAEKLFSAPTVRLMIARCYGKLNRLIEARDVYRLIVNEKLTHYAPQAFFDAQAEAAREIVALAKRIPGIHLEVTGVDRSEVTVTVDGAIADYSRPILRNPGSHVVIVEASGRAPVTRTAVLEEGSIVPMKIAFKPVPGARGPKPAPRAVPSKANVRAGAQEGPNKVLLGAGIVLSGSLVAFGVGLAVVADATARKNDPTATTGAAVACMIGGGAVGIGTVAYTILASPSAPKAVSGVHLRGWVGPEGIGVTGTW